MNNKKSLQAERFFHIYFIGERFAISACGVSAGFIISKARIKKPDIGKDAWMMIISSRICDTVKLTACQFSNTKFPKAGTPTTTTQSAVANIHSAARNGLKG